MLEAFGQSQCTISAGQPELSRLFGSRVFVKIQFKQCFMSFVKLSTNAIPLEKTTTTTTYMQIIITTSTAMNMSLCNVVNEDRIDISVNYTL